MMEADMMKKAALVTGSSNGIGEAIVMELSRLNWRLVVTGRNEKDIERVATACQQVSPSNMKPLEVVADLETEADVERLFESTMAHFHGRLDLLVNNAGFSNVLPKDTRHQEFYKNFKRTQQVNLNSAVQLTLMARHALERTSVDHNEGRPSSVINISSIASDRPVQDYAYTISKRALTMFSNCMSTEMAPRIRVNCISPGPIETKIIERSGQSLDRFKALAEQMTPLKRVGQPEEVAKAVVFLASDESASFITGSNLTIDGGATWARLRIE